MFYGTCRYECRLQNGTQRLLSVERRKKISVFEMMPTAIDAVCLHCVHQAASLALTPYGTLESAAFNSGRSTAIAVGDALLRIRRLIDSALDPA